MPVVIAIIGVAALALGAVVLIPKVLAESAKTNKLNECRNLQAELDSISIQGGDVNRQTQLRAAIARCVSEARAQGVDIDPGQAAIDSCRAQASTIDAEWAHYGTTAQEDAVARNNIRGSILKNGELMVSCIRNATRVATSLPVLDQIDAFAREQILRSYMRVKAYLNGGVYSRYGLNEPHVNDKATDEYLKIAGPLGALQIYGMAPGTWDSDDHPALGGSDGTFNSIKVGGEDYAAGVRIMEDIDRGSVLREIAVKRQELSPTKNIAEIARGRRLLGTAGIRLG